MNKKTSFFLAMLCIATITIHAQNLEDLLAGMNSEEPATQSTATETVKVAPSEIPTIRVTEPQKAPTQAPQEDLLNIPEPDVLDEIEREYETFQENVEQKLTVQEGYIQEYETQLVKLREEKKQLQETITIQKNEFQQAKAEIEEKSIDKAKARALLQKMKETRKAIDAKYVLK